MAMGNSETENRQIDIQTKIMTFSTWLVYTNPYSDKQISERLKKMDWQN